jgi:hypothetical protein
MKALVTFAAVMCFATLPAYSAEGQLSQFSLSRLGLSGMTPVSDEQGLQVRGMGMQAMGMDNGYGNNQHDHDMDDNGHKHDMNKDQKHEMHDKDHEKDHKDHNKDHNDKHHQQNHAHNQFNCQFGSKSHANMNFGNMCSHVHGCKG